MGKVLYRKYRSKSLEEVVGQEHITDTLQKALDSGRVAHAYLFTGPRGVGKTSVARILAHAVNGLPYDDSQTHIDIIEIDAASNRRIDEIRELRDKIHIAPTSAKYKVYIIDEVHMLTKEAFNALLKTLEEPPEHAIFILATTEAHKVPETIISRTQRYSFRPIDSKAALKHLQSIAKKEKIAISDEALQRIIEHSQGSFRDSISLLDQVGDRGRKIELADIDQTLGIPPSSVVEQLYDAYKTSDLKSVIDILTASQTDGYNAGVIAKQLASHIRQRMMSSDVIDGRDIILLKELVEVPASHETFTALELALIGQYTPPVIEAPSEPNSSRPAEPTAPTVEKQEEPPQPDPKAKKETMAVSTPVPKKKTGEEWPAILQAAKVRHNTLYSVLRMAQPTLTNKELTLVFAFPFHAKRIQDSKNQEVLLAIVEEVTGNKLRITCVTDPNLKTKEVEQSAQEQASSEELQAISNIFGTAELLE